MTFDEPVPTDYPLPPAESPILRHFGYDHLNPPLSVVSSWFHALAHDVERDLPAGPEKSVALRHLLYAKDAAVRSALDLPRPRPTAPNEGPAE